MSSPSEHYVSSPTFPSPHGLHSIACFSALQTETVVVAQQAKRRGGPKKVWLRLSVVDARGRTLSEHALVWKCITQKNFSNQNNISQYVRNPFGAVRMSGLAGGHELMMVVHGAATQGKLSNTVGVNVEGRAVDQHPRFLLSSGKGAEGARSTIAVFHSNADARVQLQSLTIEHRELKITFEQIGNTLLEFAPKFKTTYTAKENTEGETSSAPMPAPPAPPAAAAAAAVRVPRLVSVTSAASSASAMDDQLPAAAAAPMLAPSTSKSGRNRTAPARFSPEESAPQSRRPSLSKRLSALPPATMPAAVAERLAKCKRSLPSLEVSEPAAAAAAAASASTATLDSPQAPAETNARMSVDLLGLESPQPPPLESAAAAAAAERSPKRSLFGSPDPAFVAAAAAAQFSGFDPGFDFSSQETEMLDVTDGQVQLDESDDGGDSPDSADATPRMDGHTPPPFMHQLGFNDDSANPATDADDLTMMADTLDEAEGRCSHTDSDDMMDRFGLSGLAGLPGYMRPKRRLAAAAGSAAEPATLPLELAAASSKDGSVSFSMFGSGPQHLSPGLNGYHSSPPSLGGLDLNGLPRSPMAFLSLHDPVASPLPPLNLAPCPSSPLPAFAISLGDQSLPNFCRPQQA